VPDDRTSLVVFGLPFNLSHRALRQLLDEGPGCKGEGVCQATNE
jgi:hypothetical protein